MIAYLAFSDKYVFEQQKLAKIPSRTEQYFVF